MHELITPAQAEWLFAGLAVILLIAGISAAIGARAAVERRLGRRGLILLVASGPLIYALWRLDAALIVVLGFDTVVRLAVELLIFVGLGALLGLWLRAEPRGVEPSPEAGHGAGEPRAK